MAEGPRNVIEIPENETTAECIGPDAEPLKEAGSHPLVVIHLKKAPNQSIYYGDCPTCNTRFFSWIEHPSKK